MDGLPYRPCVGIVLRNAEGLIFAAQRLDAGRLDSDSARGAWQMPQGGIDDGEEPRVAALRELFEETSVSAGDVEIIDQTRDWLSYDLPVELIPHLWNGQFRGQKQLWFLMQFIGDDGAINIATETPEFSCWQWMDARELVDKIVPFKRELYGEVFKAFGLLGQE